MLALKRKERRPFPAPVTIHGYQTPVASEEISTALETRDTRVAVGRELTKGIVCRTRRYGKEISQNVPSESEQAQNEA